MTYPCGGAFGSGGVGSSPFGSGSLLYVVSAREEALNAVLVTFSTPPEMVDPASIFDALCPSNWTLSVLSPFDATTRLVQWCERVDALTVRVLLDGPLSAPATYSILASSTIRDMAGVPIYPSCVSTSFSTFPPVWLPPEQRERTEAPADLNNPWLAKDASEGPDAPLGTYQVTDSGDYALERGRAYLRKRVLRRATTMQGEFFHLPSYGFAPQLKGLIRPSLLRSIAAKAAAQIRLEPDVESVSVEASLVAGDTNVVLLDIKVSDRYGRAEELQVPVRLGSA